MEFELTTSESNAELYNHYTMKRHYSIISFASSILLGSVNVASIIVTNGGNRNGCEMSTKPQIRLIC